MTVTMEQHDLGPSMNDELRVFIGDFDLVRYGRLKDPHHRQLETWGNKDAGALKLTVDKEMSAPPKDAPGRYEIIDRLNRFRPGGTLKTQYWARRGLRGKMLKPKPSDWEP